VTGLRVAAVQASREAEAEMGARRSAVGFWLYRHLARSRASRPTA
jgi:hypothetical protein